MHHAGPPIRSVALLVDRAQILSQPGLLRISCPRRAVHKGVKTADRHCQHTTQNIERIMGPLSSDEGVPHLGSFAKNAVAFFRISRSILSRAFSALRRESSLSSSSTGLRFGERSGRPALAAVTQLARDLTGMPSCRAASARPIESDRATAWLLKSSV